MFKRYRITAPSRGSTYFRIHYRPYLFFPFDDWEYITSTSTFEGALEAIKRDKEERLLNKIKYNQWFVK